MYISARVDYGIRALLTLAAAAEEDAGPLKSETVAERQQLPVKFVETILVELRRAGFVTSQRGSVGGYRLGRPAAEIALADVFRALEGPLAEVRGERPEHTHYAGAAEHLQEVWIAVRASLRSVLEATTVADVLHGRLPRAVTKLVGDADAWQARA